MKNTTKNTKETKETQFKKIAMRKEKDFEFDSKNLKTNSPTTVPTNKILPSKISRTLKHYATKRIKKKNRERGRE